MSSCKVCGVILTRFNSPVYYRNTDNKNKGNLTPDETTSNLVNQPDMCASCFNTKEKRDLDNVAAVLKTTEEKFDEKLESLLSDTNSIKLQQISLKDCLKSYSEKLEDFTKKIEEFEEKFKNISKTESDDVGYFYGIDDDDDDDISVLPH